MLSVTITTAMLGVSLLACPENTCSSPLAMGSDEQIELQAQRLSDGTDSGQHLGFMGHYRIASTYHTYGGTDGSDGLLLGLVADLGAGYGLKPGGVGGEGGAFVWMLGVGVSSLLHSWNTLYPGALLVELVVAGGRDITRWWTEDWWATVAIGPKILLGAGSLVQTELGYQFAPRVFATAPIGVDRDRMEHRLRLSFGLGAAGLGAQATLASTEVRSGSGRRDDHLDLELAAFLQLRF